MRVTRTTVKLVIAGAVVASFVMCTASRAALAETDDRGYQIKAAFLKHFAQYVTWPEDSLRESDPLRVCVAGVDPFGALLERMSRQSVQGRRIVAEHVGTIEGLSKCNVVFVPALSGVDQEGILRSLSGKPILTVGEDETFLERGGMVNFLMHKNKTRFDIAWHSATAAGLRLSSPFLALANRVVE